MNFEALKMGFISYLMEKKGDTPDGESFNDTNVSIFMYSEEFKDYVIDKLNLDSSAYNESLSDILSMEVVNGQLVNPEEEQDLTDETMMPQNPMEENPPIDNGENTELPDNSGIITGLLNNLLENEAFSGAIDANGDGTLEEEEMTNFFNTINSNDSNESTISLEDILVATESIQNGTFEITTPETIEESLLNETPLTPTAEATHGSSSSGNNGGGGSYGDNLVANNTTQKDTNSLNNKSLTELQEMLPPAKSDVTTAQDLVDKAMDAVNDNSYKTAMDESMTAYLEYLEQIQSEDDTFAADIKTKNEEISTSQDKITQLDKDITKYLIESSGLETTISDTTASITALNEAKSSLQSSIASADEEDKGDLQTKLNNITNQISANEKKKEEAEAALKKLEEETIPEAEKAKADEEEVLKKLEESLAELMTAAEEKYAAKYPELATLKTNYETAKTEFEKQKETAQAAVVTAVENLANAQTKLNELNTAISKAETSKTIKENSPSGMTTLTQTAVELAYSQLGVYEDKGDNRGTMEKYGGRPGDPWCASFVSWLYGKGQEGNESPIKYTAGVSGLRDQAQQAGYYSKVGTYTPVPGDIMIQKSNGASHTGIVVGVDGDYIYTIEGNSGNAVRERKYKIGSSEYSKISGWIRMNEWSGGSSNVSQTTYIANNNSEDADKEKRSTL